MVHVCCGTLFSAGCSVSCYCRGQRFRRRRSEVFRVIMCVTYFDTIGMPRFAMPGDDLRRYANSKPNGLKLQHVAQTDHSITCCVSWLRTSGTTWIIHDSLSPSFHQLRSPIQLCFVRFYVRFACLSLLLSLYDTYICVYIYIYIYIYMGAALFLHHYFLNISLFLLVFIVF